MGQIVRRGEAVAKTLTAVRAEPAKEETRIDGRSISSRLDQATDLEEGFLSHADLFKARTCLSILYYPAKVHKDDSEEFRQILVEAERSLAAVAAGRGA
jgi:hypothetical protein